MNELHPVATLIMNSLSRGPGAEVTFTISAKARASIAAEMRKAVVIGQGAEARRDGLAMIGLLLSNPKAKSAVHVLQRLSAELAAEVGHGIEAHKERTAGRVKEGLKTTLGRTISKEAAAYGAAAPRGTVKQRDLAPPRNPRFMR